MPLDDVIVSCEAPRPPRPTPQARLRWGRRPDEIIAITPRSSPEDIEAWVIANLAASLGTDPLGINPGQPLRDLGMGAIHARRIASGLERAVGGPLPEALFGEEATAASIASALVSERSADDATFRAVRRPRSALDRGEGSLRPSGSLASAAWAWAAGSTPEVGGAPAGDPPEPDGR